MRTEISHLLSLEQLHQYKKWLKEKTQEFVKALADEGMQISRAKFQSATYDGTNDVSVSVESRGENKAAVVAMPDKESLIGKLAEMYNEPIMSLIDEPDEKTGNVEWVTSW